MCEHEKFEANVDINRLTDIGKFAADIRVRCKDCGTPFQFLGLPAGLDMEGASVSVDGTEARLAIVPYGQARTTLEGINKQTLRGYRVYTVNEES